jgi:hypothetical protein|tara:strand:- start:1128 stop:1358 length:231 start_codon:yes stop_codon:yes gene_type:complete
MNKFLRVNEEDWGKMSKQDVVNILRKYLEEEKATSYRKMISEESFSSPSWAEQQSFLLGDLKRIERLLNFLPDKGN